MYLLKQLTIADPASPHDGSSCDLLLAGGKILAIDTVLEAKAGAVVIDMSGHYASPGFLDIGAYLGDPGHEEREDIESLAAAALFGGYTAVAVLPNTHPPRHDKSGVRYLQERSKGLAVHLLPLGAVSQDTAGKDITEMIDMKMAGAVAFTDGLHSISDAGLMLRALQYAKHFEGTIINQPLHPKLSQGAQMHEGYLSTQLGMLGFPTMSETLVVQRDLELLEYTQSRLLIHLLSAAKSVELVAAAKQKGLVVSASVSAMHLQFTEEELYDFDSNFKLLPPLRAEEDRQALLAAIRSGVIDCVVSNHVGCQVEQKELEFPYADFGCLGLETAFAQTATVLAEQLSPGELAALFSAGPRQALGLAPQSIAVGQAAVLSFFRLEDRWTVRPQDLAARSRNTPMIGKSLLGRPSGIFQSDTLHLLPHL